jgi:hypothetical protein
MSQKEKHKHEAAQIIKRARKMKHGSKSVGVREYFHIAKKEIISYRHVHVHANVPWCAINTRMQ